MDEIIVAIKWADINHAKINKVLAKRFYGWLPAFIIPLVAIATFTILTIALKSYLGAKTFHLGMSIAVFPVFAAFFVTGRLNAYWKKKLMRAVSSAPIRQGVHSIIMTADGITTPNSTVIGTLGWSKITEVIEVSDTTLILFSPIEYFPLPDSDLPDGITRAALLDQIAKWREA